jgi:branched-subunit amino acid transport protein
MIEWSLIIYCGLVTFLSRYLMIAILKKEMFTDRIREVLSFVPSAVFPAIIFPAIFINDHGSYIEMNDPKIFGAIVAVLVGYFSKNVIATIFSGLLSYWFVIFIF